jgi:hypothetical protein
MPCVGIEPTIPASERAKTVHDLDRSATVTGTILTQLSQITRAGSAVGIGAGCGLDDRDVGV